MNEAANQQSGMDTPEEQATALQKPKRDKVSLPLEASALLAIVVDDSNESSLRRKAFEALEKQALKSPVQIDSMLLEHISADSPFLERWIATELGWARQVPADHPVREHIDALVTPDVPGVAARIWRSMWVSVRGYPEKAVELAKERASRTPAPPKNPRLDFHPLLAVSGEVQWPPLNAGALDDPLLLSASLDAAILDLVDLGLPLAREIATRRGLLQVRLSRSNIEKGDARLIKAVKKALEYYVHALTEAIEEDSLDRARLSFLLELARFAGRSPDLWALVDRQRAVLTKAAPSDAPRASLWAIAFCSMPSASPLVLSALDGVSDQALMALLDEALPLELQSIVGRIQDLCLARVNAGTASDELWTRLSQIAPVSKTLERWWRTHLAARAPATLVTHDAGTRGALIVNELRSCTMSQLLATPVSERLRSIAPQDRMRSLGIIITRLEREVPAERDRQVQSVKETLRAQDERIKSILAALLTLFGAVPDTVRESANEAQRLLEIERQRIAAASSALPGHDDRSLNPQRDADVIDLLSSLMLIERIRDPQQQRSAIVRLRQHLLWIVSSKAELAAPVLAELPALSAEALSVVVHVAVQSGNPALIRGIGLALSESATLRVIWRATLAANASRLGESLKFDDALAVASSELLEVHADELRGRVIALRSPKTWLTYTEQSSEAVGQLREALASTQRHLASLISRF